MFAELRRSPLLTRLIGKPTWLSLRLCFWLVLGLGTANLILISMALGNKSSSLDSLIAIALVLASGLVFVSPSIVTIVASAQTLRHVSSEEFELLKATLVADSVIVWEQALAALYACRLLLVIVLVSVPVMVIGPMYYAPQITSMGISNYLLSIVEGSLSVLGLLGMNFWGAVNGVETVLRYRNVVASLLLPPTVIMALCLLCCASAIPWVNAYQFDLVKMMFRIAFSLAPYILGLIGLYNASRWVRRT